MEANETWIDENEAHGKNEFELDFSSSKCFSKRLFTSVGDRPMGKRTQDRFRRLAIVSPVESNAQQKFAAGRRRRESRRVESERTREEKEQFQSLRMAVMPTLSRGMWIEAMIWIRDFVRSYFRVGDANRTGAVVLPFRSNAASAQNFRRMMAEEEFVSKKANGSVRWNSEREVAPQEGGRG